MNKKILISLFLVLFVLGCKTPYEQMQDKLDTIEVEESTKINIEEKGIEISEPEKKDEEIEDTNIYIEEGSKVGSVYISKIEKTISNDGETLLKIYAKANEYIDKVKVKDIKVGVVRPIECNPAIGGSLQLINGEGYIFCRFNGNIGGILRVDLDYETQGKVSVSFLEGSPPLEILDGGRSNFDVTLVITNLGPGSIRKKECKAQIRGIRPSDWDQTDDSLTKYLITDLESNQIGKIIFTRFIFLSTLASELRFPIVADYDCGISQGTIRTSVLVKH